MRLGEFYGEFSLTLFKRYGAQRHLDANSLQNLGKAFLRAKALFDSHPIQLEVDCILLRACITTQMNINYLLSSGDRFIKPDRRLMIVSNTSES